VCLVGAMGALKYAIIGVVVAVIVVIALVLLLQTPHRAPVQYVGSPSGYEAFVPIGTISSNGQTYPVGDLILPNGTTIHDVILKGPEDNIIIQDHNQVMQLDAQYAGQTDTLNGQPFLKNIVDVYAINGLAQIKQVEVNGQLYYEIYNIPQSKIAGFLTYNPYQFEAAINTPGISAAVLPGNSPVFNYPNAIGTFEYQTIIYSHYGPFAGGAVFVFPNGTIFPYGVITNIAGSSFNNYIFVQHTYTPSS